ncbi:MAG: sugar ABC transporter permease [Oscillospiraceae bacterium]|nr:sugar ABC transporter permease [Oscillospiraceae bacterium]
MASAAQRRIKSISYAKYGYMFIAPFFLVYCFFQIWPLIYTFILSFKGNQANNAAWVGFDNYSTILFGQGMAQGSAATSAEFFKALGNTFILWFGNFIPQILLSLLLAVWFTDAKVKLPGKGFFKVVMYMPNIITAASVAALYVNLFGDSKYYFVNATLMNMGMADPIHFVADPVISKIMVMFIQTWLWFGNTMIMLMSGIMGINPSLFEAADIDGANSRQVFFKITLPLLQPIMVYTLVTSMIGGLQMFDIPYLYHNGANFSKELETVAVFIYFNFNKGTVEQASYGYAGAASIIIFAITAILGSITFYMNRDKDEIAQKKQRKRAEKQYKAKMKKGGLTL